jgi:hypothetical protein
VRDLPFRHIPFIPFFCLIARPACIALNSPSAAMPSWQRRINHHRLDGRNKNGRDNNTP